MWVKLKVLVPFRDKFILRCTATRRCQCHRPSLPAATVAAVQYKSKVGPFDTFSLSFHRAGISFLFTGSSWLSKRCRLVFRDGHTRAGHPHLLCHPLSSTAMLTRVITETEAQRNTVAPITIGLRLGMTLHRVHEALSPFPDPFSRTCLPFIMIIIVVLSICPELICMLTRISILIAQHLPNILLTAPTRSLYRPKGNRITITSHLGF